jgi:uncharacterized membrane protein (UPF0127 family)
MLFKLVNGEVVANKIKYADTFSGRFLGLMFKRQFPVEYDALLITPCNAVHTMFMRYPIDVLFLDRDLKVLYIYEEMRPGRLSPSIKNAAHVVELAAGSVQKSKLVEGDILYLNSSAKVV